MTIIFQGNSIYINKYKESATASKRNKPFLEKSKQIIRANDLSTSETLLLQKQTARI